MKRNIQIVLGVLLAIIGFSLQNEWGFLFLIIGGYLFFSFFLDKTKPPFQK